MSRLTDQVNWSISHYFSHDHIWHILYLYHQILLLYYHIHHSYTEFLTGLSVLTLHQTISITIESITAAVFTRERLFFQSSQNIHVPPCSICYYKGTYISRRAMLSAVAPSLIGIASIMATQLSTASKVKLMKRMFLWQRIALLEGDRCEEKKMGNLPEERTGFV